MHPHSSSRKQKLTPGICNRYIFPPSHPSKRFTVWEPDTPSSLFISALNCIAITLTPADPHAPKVSTPLLSNIYCSKSPIDTGEESQSLSMSHYFVVTSSSSMSLMWLVPVIHHDSWNLHFADSILLFIQYWIDRIVEN